MQHRHEQQVQPDVQQSGDAEEPQGHHGVSHRPQQTGEEIIKKCGGQSAENNQQIVPHGAVQLVRYLQKAENGIGQQIDAQIQHQRHGADEGKGVGHGGPERLFVSAAEADGKQCARAHGQP